jgi:hypothetical protein
VTHTHVGMGMGVNPYPPVYMGDPMGLFFCRGYGYKVVIPGGYLPIAISSSTVGALTCGATRQSGGAPDRSCRLSGAPSGACSDFCARRRVL